MKFFERFIAWYKNTNQDLEQFSTRLQISKYRCKQLLQGKSFTEIEEKKLIYSYNLNPAYFFVYEQPVYQKKVHKKTKNNFTQLIKKIINELPIKKVYYPKTYDIRRILVIKYNVNPNYFYFADEDMFNNSLVKYPEVFTKEYIWDAKQWLLDIQKEHNINILDDLDLDNLNSKDFLNKINNLRVQLRQIVKKDLQLKNNKSLYRKSRIFTERLNKIPVLFHTSPYKISKELNTDASNIYHWREGRMPGEDCEKRIIQTYKIDPMYFYLYDVKMYSDGKREISGETFIEKTNKVIKELRNTGIRRKSIFKNLGFGYLVNNSNIGFFEFRRRLMVVYHVNPYYFYYENEPMFNKELDKIGSKYPSCFSKDQGWDAKQWLLEIIDGLDTKQDFKVSFNGLNDIQLINLANDVKRQLKVEFEKVLQQNKTEKKPIKEHKYNARLHNSRFSEKIKTILKYLNKNVYTLAKELNINRMVIYLWEKGALPREKCEKKFVYKYNINPEYLYGFSSIIFNYKNKKIKDKTYSRCMYEIKKVLDLFGIQPKDIAMHTGFLRFANTSTMVVTYEFRRRLSIIYDINPNYFFYEEEPMFKYNLCKYPHKFLQTESWDAKQWLLDNIKNRNIKNLTKEEINLLTDKQLVKKANNLKNNQ